RSQALKREHRVGERRGLGQRLPHEAAPSKIEIEDRLEPTAGTEETKQCTRFLSRGGVVRRLGASRDLSHGKGAGALGERRVVRFQERSDQSGIGHATRTPARASR